MVSRALMFSAYARASTFAKPIIRLSNIETYSLLLLQMKPDSHTFIRSRQIIALILAIAVCSSAQTYRRDQENAWGKVIQIVDGLIGLDGVMDAENKADALIDLHAQFSRDILGKPVSTQRVALVKEGFRLFLKTSSQRYRGSKRQATLRLLRDLAANRGVFVELLSADSPASVIEQQLLGYLERNQQLSYKEPVPIDGQFKVTEVESPMRIVADAVRMVADRGTSGHYNRAIDAGEHVTLKIPLKNVATHAFRSTSAILESNDKYVHSNVSKVVYTERAVVGGETVTFAPGKTIAPRQNFSFTIAPNCPDNHKVEFELHVGDSDFGEFVIPFSLTVYQIGPLDFGKAHIDDDRFGDSDGNKNFIMDAGETIELVLPLQNAGPVEVENISAKLFCSDANVQFKPGYNENRYKAVAPLSERPIPASFVFTLAGARTEFQKFIYLRLLTRGSARGFDYSWLRTQAYYVGFGEGWKISEAQRSGIYKVAHGQSTMRDEIVWRGYVVRDDLPDGKKTVLFLTKKEDFFNSKPKFYLDPNDETEIYYPIALKTSTGKMATSIGLLDLNFMGRMTESAIVPTVRPRTLNYFAFGENLYVNSNLSNNEETDVGFITSEDPQLLPVVDTRMVNDIFRFKTRIKSSKGVFGWKRIKVSEWHRLNRDGHRR